MILRILYGVGRVLTILAVGACAVVPAACASAPKHKTNRPPKHGTQPRTHDASVLPKGNFWTTPLPANAPLDPRSSTLVNSLVDIVKTTTDKGRPPWISTKDCAAHIVTVPANQPTVHVTLDQPHVRAFNVALRAAFNAVPLPANAVPSDCSDSILIVQQPSTDKMWELWKARRGPDGWHFKWGGATDHMSTNDGSFGPSDWPGARYDWGASASSMVLADGMMRLSEFQAGHIDHAITMGLPNVAADVWSWPAQRSDGTLHGPDAIPYGARFRLPPSLNIDAMNLPPATKIIAKAAQKYGLVVRERTHWNVGLAAEAAPAGVTPNPWKAILGPHRAQVLEAFPWDKLELVRMSLRSKPGPKPGA